MSGADEILSVEARTRRLDAEISKLEAKGFEAIQETATSCVVENSEGERLRLTVDLTGRVSISHVVGDVPEQPGEQINEQVLPAAMPTEGGRIGRVFPAGWPRRRKMIVSTIVAVAVLLVVASVFDNTDDTAPTARTSRPAAATVAGAPASAASSLTSAERSYAIDAQKQLDTLQSSFSRFSLLATDARVTSPGWKADIRKELSIWRLTYNRASAATPPARFTQFHRQYVAALSKVDDAADAIDAGVSSLNSNEITRATTLLQDARRLLAEAFAQLPDVK